MIDNSNFRIRGPRILFVVSLSRAQICVNFNSTAHAHFCAYLRDEAIPNEIILVGTLELSQLTCVPCMTYVEPKQFEPKLDNRYRLYVSSKNLKIECIELEIDVPVLANSNEPLITLYSHRWYFIPLLFPGRDLRLF